jgi:hypothetical protein
MSAERGIVVKVDDDVVILPSLIKSLAHAFRKFVQDDAALLHQENIIGFEFALVDWEIVTKLVIEFDNDWMARDMVAVDVV